MLMFFIAAMCNKCVALTSEFPDRGVELNENGAIPAASPYYKAISHLRSESREGKWSNLILAGMIFFVPC